jgi:hypothetical protein
MTESSDDLTKQILAALNDAIRLAHWSCGIELQREAVRNLKSWHDRLGSLRESHIARHDEPNANAAFRAEMMASGLSSFLMMWVLLKEFKSAEAWKELVEAELDLGIAQRIEADEWTAGFMDHLLRAERLLFPPQLFYSLGYTYSEAFCTICGERYGDCNHVKGRIYMGRICRRRIPTYKIMEQSLTPYPEDKGCRVEVYARDGKVLCTLTRKELPQEVPVDPKDHWVSGIVHRFN